MARKDNLGASLELPSPHLSTRNRATPPVLSPGTLRLAQSTPQSNLTSASSLLSPPISDLPVTSPPPRAEDEDYLGSRAKQKPKKRSRYRGSRQHRSNREGSEEISSTHKLLKSTSPVVASPETYSVSGNIGSPGGDSLDSVNQTPTTRPNFPVLPTPSRVQTFPKAFAAVDHATNEKSPAVKSLRKHSVTGKAQGSSNIRRLSQTLSSALGRLFPPAITPQRGSPKATDHRLCENPARPIIEGSSSVPYDYNSDVPVTQSRTPPSGLGPEPPASITLRKASRAPPPPVQAYAKPEVKDQNAEFKYEPSLVTMTQTTELVAFRSMPSAALDRSEALSGATSESELYISRASSQSTSAANKVVSKPVVSIVGTTLRPRATTAGTVLTFADTHVAPGASLIEAKSRRASVTSGVSSRRISVVQFRSRDSVHEIIWQEEESTSESSSSKRLSPDQAEFLSGATSVINEETFVRTQAPGSGSVQKEYKEAEGRPKQIDLHQNLFDWTWGRPTQQESTVEHQAEGNIRKRRKSNQLESKRKSGDNGRVGSSIGSSSHQRVQQRLNRSSDG